MSTARPAAPLDFCFHVAEPHDRVPVTRLRIAAHIRHSLWRNGIETLAELEGLTGRDIACFHDLEARAAIRVVSAVRWRCSRHLPAWPLLRATTVDHLQIPVNATRYLRTAGCGTLDDVVRLDPETVPMLADRIAPGLEQLLDRYARLAQVPAQRLRAITACHDPYVLPRIDPLIVLALALAEGPLEKMVALTLGMSTNDSALLLAYWGMNGMLPRSFEALGRRFGVTGERARQVVLNRETELAHAGLRVRLPSSELVDARFTAGAAMLRRLGLVAC